MRKNFLILGILLVMICVAGCAGKQSATVSMQDQTSYKNGTGEVIKFDSSSLSLLIPPPCPDQMGRLLEARANAKLTERMAEQIGARTTNYQFFRGIIINDDLSNSAFVAHPEKSKKLTIPSNSHKFIYTTCIPNKITVYDAKGGYTVAKVDKKGGVYNGLPYQYGIRIYKIYR